MENTSEIRKSKEESIGKFVADHLAKIQPSLSSEGLTLTFLEGEARKELPLIAPNKVHLSGTIKAPGEFYSKRKDLHNPDKCHVLYNMLSGTIKLVVDENFATDNYEVTGKIEKNAELGKFAINSGSAFDPKDLLNVLKFNRIYFSDKSENAKVVTALSQFKAKVSQAFESSDDLRGEAKASLESKIEHDLQESFMLEIALFKGQAKQKFKVDICLQVRSGSCQVYLESVELKDMEMQMLQDIVSKELETFSSIVCIEQ